MSNLSQFIQKPLSGLSQVSTTQWLLASTRPLWTYEATDVTAGGEAYPQLQLKTDRNVANAGGSLQFLAQNSTPAFITHASISGIINTLAAGAESSQLDYTLYVAGSQKKISMRGDLAAVIPAVDGTWALGTSAFHWNGVYSGDGTRAGAFIPDVGTASMQIGATTAHALCFLTNGVVRARFDTIGRFATNDVISAATMVHLGGAHAGNATTLKGFDATLTLPATTTVQHSDFVSAPSTVAAAFTLATLVGFDATEPVRGAGSTITQWYGVRAVSTGANANLNTGVYINLSSGYSLYSAGLGLSFFQGGLTVTGQLAAPGGITTMSNGAGTTAYFASAGTTNIINNCVLAVDYYNGVLVDLFRVGLQGGSIPAIVYGSYTPQDGRVVTTQGGTAIVPSALFHLAFPGFAGDTCVYEMGTPITSSYDIPFSNCAAVFSALPSLNFNGVGSSYRAFQAISTVATGAVTSSATGLYASFSSILATNALGADLTVAGAVSHTGNLYGIRLNVSAAGTTTLSLGAQVVASNHVNNGFLVSGTSQAADIIDLGFAVDNTVKINTFAFQYTQRAGATGGFVSYVNSGAASLFSIDVNGDTTWGGATRRLKGDFNNATHANRTIFINASAGLQSLLGVAPSAGGTTAGFIAYGNPDPSNSSYLQSSHDGSTAATLLSTAVGTGTIYPLQAKVGAQIVPLSLETNGDIRLGAISGMVTTSTFGYAFITAVAGAPTGVPTARAGFVALQYDTTNHKIWIYDTAWKGVVVA